MPTHATPGVYTERMDAGRPTITAIRTDVAGFVGIAERGPVDMPVPVESWRQFQAHFGEFTGAGFLAYAVRGFFENGGVRCWIVRVASDDPAGGARAASFDLHEKGFPFKPFWQIDASSQGVWGNQLSISFRETNAAQTIGVVDPQRPDRLRVANTSGFERGSLVRITQGAHAPVFRVVADVDATSGFLAPDPSPLLTPGMSANPTRDVPKYLVWDPKEDALRLNYATAPLVVETDRPVIVESMEYTLLVEQRGIPIALYRSLSLIPEHPHYGPVRLGAFRVPTDVEAQRLLPAPPEPVSIVEARPDYQVGSPAKVRQLNLPEAPVENEQLKHGADGLRLLRVSDFIGEPSDPLESDEVRKSKTRGLRALEAIDEVSILAVPDIHVQPVEPPQIAPLPQCIVDSCLPHDNLPVALQIEATTLELPPTFSNADIFHVESSMVLQCEEKRDRFALLDPPRSASRDDELGISAIQAWRHQFDTSHAALYYPWLRVVDPLRIPGQLTRDIPPSGHVAGQFARTDLAEGVHKAPANASLTWVQDVSVALNDAQHGILNPIGIDAIRTLPGRGIRIFGARTVSSDPDWRYVNVRRLMMMIEKAIDLSTQWSVFEPNDHVTRAKIRLALTSFLLAIWQRGALAGNTANEAFFVRCDETNNSPVERESGRLNALVGVAPTIPYEFVVLRVWRTQNEFEIGEEATSKGAR